MNLAACLVTRLTTTIKKKKQFNGNVLEKCFRYKWWKCRNDWKVWRSWEMEFYFLMQRPIFLLHSTTAPFLPSSIIIWSTLTQSNVVEKHCQRHNGSKGWVLLTKVTFLGHISSFTQWFLGHNCKKNTFSCKGSHPARKVQFFNIVQTGGEGVIPMFKNDVVKFV